MRGLTSATLGLIVAVLVCRAEAQDVQWRPVNPAPAPQRGFAVRLQAPIAESTPVRQASFYSSPAGDDSMLIRANSNQTPGQPMPVGPVLNDVEPGPAPTAVNPPTVMKDQGGHIITNQGLPPDVVMGSPMGGDCGCNSCVVNGNCDSCGGCCDCCDCSWWDRLCGWWALRPWHYECCDSCCDSCCDPCCGPCCAPRSCFWVSGEYLGWTVKGAPLPPLVTVNPGGSTNLALGSPATSLVFGGNNQSLDYRSGGRFTVGFAVPCTCDRLGIEATYFFLADDNRSASFGPSTGFESIGRPFVNVGTSPPANGLDAEIVAVPANGVNGRVAINTSNQFWGAELNLRYPITCGCSWKLDFLGGFRYLNLAESLGISENITVTQTTPSDPTTFAVFDSFSTRNIFYGGQLGFDAECRWRRLFFGATGKLALGDMHETVNIDGGTVITGGAGAGTFRGGLLALNGTNIGSYTRDTFAVAPELSLRLGFYITEHLRAYVGYNVIYMSSVVRPGDQVDLHVNPSYQPNGGPPFGAALPAFQFRATDFWAQGFTAGLELRF